MKNLLFIIALMMLGASSNVSAKQTILIKSGDHLPTIPGNSKAPARPWYIDVTDNIITMSATAVDYVLNLYDEDGEVAYTVLVPLGTTQIVLPSTLSGSFELRFETDTYYYYGEITL